MKAELWVQTVRKFAFLTSVAVFLMGLFFLLVYRYCQQAGPAESKACLFAAVTAAASGMLACWPVFRLRNKEQSMGVAAVVLGSAIRSLTGFAGVVIVLVFIDIHRGWFLFCFGLFYCVFLLTGSWVLLRLLHYHGLKENESEYEQFRDIACQHGSARRDYQ